MAKFFVNGEPVDFRAKTAGRVAKKADNPEAMKGAAKTIVAEYQVPFLAHAPMEPLNCTVEVRKDGAEIWTSSQFQGVDHRVLKVLEFAAVKSAWGSASGAGGRQRALRAHGQACPPAPARLRPVDITGHFSPPGIEIAFAWLNLWL